MSLRSPRERLGGYVLLPRLIDKVRLQVQGQLPAVYVKNLLGPSPTTLDGQFLAFAGLDGEELREAILSADSNEAILAWIERQAKPHSLAEKQEGAEKIGTYRADVTRVAYRQQMYPDLAAKVDVGALGVFDLIDMDEGRIPTPRQVR